MPQLKINTVTGCCYIPPGLQLPSQLLSITTLSLVPNYTTWWQRQRSDYML